MHRQVTPEQVEEIRKRANEKGVSWQAFRRLLDEDAFDPILDGVLAPRDDIISAIEEGRTELWFHPDQQAKYATARSIVRLLAEEDLLDSCISLYDLKAILAQDIEFWRKHFNGKAIIAARSVQDDLIWCLCERLGKLVLVRHWLSHGYRSKYGTLRICKKVDQ